jgi:hypothetical protein
VTNFQQPCFEKRGAFCFFKGAMIEHERLREQLQPFEGMWLMTKPSGAIACAKSFGANLLVPYSFGNEGKLSGHYYDFRIVGQTLFGRFEPFDSTQGGFIFLGVGQNQTLKGGRWLNDQVPESVKRDVLKLTEFLPEMEPVVWLRMPQAETPGWAERYFREDWPNKPF